MRGAASISDVAAASPFDVDPTVARSARVHACYLGVDAYFEVDRVVAEHAAAAHPQGIETARASADTHRAFLVRVVRWLAREGRVGQFVTVGWGVPQGDGLHVIAQGVVPEARMVYIDADPVVLAHAHQLRRTSTTEGQVWCLQGDVGSLGGIEPQLAELLDLDAPAAVVLAGSLHHLPDSSSEHDPHHVVGRLMDLVPSGSYLALCHPASDIHPVEMTEVARRLNEATAEAWVVRDHDQVARFFDNLELVEPGVVQIDRWHPEDHPMPVLPPDGCTNPLWVGLGRKS